jgi:glycosylphosphatidylinositol deacylase
MILFAIAVYSAVYGVSYAYLLHHLANILAAWFVIIYFFSSGVSFRRLWGILEGDDAPHGMSEPGGSHQKKKP